MPGNNGNGNDDDNKLDLSMELGTIKKETIVPDETIVPTSNLSDTDTYKSLFHQSEIKKIFKQIKALKKKLPEVEQQQQQPPSAGLQVEQQQQQQPSSAELQVEQQQQQPPSAGLQVEQQQQQQPSSAGLQVEQQQQQPPSAGLQVEQQQQQQPSSAGLQVEQQQQQQQPSSAKLEPPALFSFLPVKSGNSSASSDLHEVPTEITVSGAKWAVSDSIGAGSFGDVYEGKPLGQVALKFFRLQSPKSVISELEKEVSLLAKLSHKNIVSYINCANPPSYFVIIMEYISGGSLYSLLKPSGQAEVFPLSKDTLKRYLVDILHGLQYLHSKDFVHCDVKPHNILLADNDTVKITDFGSAILRSAAQNGGGAVTRTPLLALGSSPGSSKQNTGASGLIARGTTYYMAPEALSDETIEFASDIWSLGVTVAELYNGKVPWQTNEIVHLAALDKAAKMNFAAVTENSADETQEPNSAADAKKEPLVPIFPPGCDADVQDFVSMCLKVDPKDRGTIDDLLKSNLLK